MLRDVDVKLGADGPDPSARALVLAVVLLQGGEAEVEDVMVVLDDPDHVGWNDSVRGELLQLAGAGVLTVAGDRVTLTLNEEGWRRVSVTLATGVAELARRSELPATQLVAQVVEQVPKGDR